VDIMAVSRLYEMIVADVMAADERD